MFGLARGLGRLPPGGGARNSVSASGTALMTRVEATPGNTALRTIGSTSRSRRTSPAALVAAVAAGVAVVTGAAVSAESSPSTKAEAAIDQVSRGSNVTLVFTKRVSASLIEHEETVITAEEHAFYSGLLPEESTVRVTLGDDVLRVVETRAGVRGDVVEGIEDSKNGDGDSQLRVVEDVTYDFRNNRVYYTPHGEEREIVAWDGEGGGRRSTASHPTIVVNLHALVALRLVDFRSQMKSKIAMAAATTAGGPNLEDVLVAGDGGNGDDIDVFNLEILLGVDRTAAVGDSTDVIEAVEIPTDAGYQYIHSTAVDASGGDGGGGDGGGGDAMVGGQPVTGSREFATVKWMSPEQQAALKRICVTGQYDALSKFFLYHALLHPTVYRHVTSLRRFPRALSYSYNVGMFSKEVEFELSQVVLDDKLDVPFDPYLPRPANAALPDNASLFSCRFADDRRLDGIVRSALEHGSIDEAVVRAEMEASIADARAGKRNLDVLLSLFRFNLQTGDSGVGQRVQAFHTDMATGPADGDWDFFAAGLAATGSASPDFEQIQGLYNAITPNKYKLGAMIDVMKGVAAFRVDPDAAVPILLQALGAEPTLAAVYKDLGIAFWSASQMWEAWACFDTLRFLRSEHPLVADVRNLEGDIREALPHFFARRHTQQAK